jgi:hypothetical protein
MERSYRSNQSNSSNSIWVLPDQTAFDTSRRSAGRASPRSASKCPPTPQRTPNYALDNEGQRIYSVLGSALYPFILYLFPFYQIPSMAFRPSV